MSTTNDLRYTATKTYTERGTKYRMTLNIRLNDEFRNGHEDFSLTADIYELTPRGAREYMGGCCHDEIKKVFPSLHAMFEPLHLADWEGSAMHCVANGRYHLTRGEDEYAKNTLRVTDTELEHLEKFMHDGDLFFSYQMEKMGLRERYRAEALAATAKLEELTGQKFESKATRQQWPSLTPEQVTDLEEKEAAGYFTPEAAEARKQTKVAAEAAEGMAKLERDRDKAIAKARNIFLVDRAILLVLGACRMDENIIFYDHTNTICANWNNFGTKWTPETLAGLEAKMRAHDLPAGVKFEIKAA